jgi:hypothetical protein
MKYKKRGGTVLTGTVLRQRRAHARAQAEAEAEAEAQRRAAVRAETLRQAAEWRSRRGSPQNDEERARAVEVQQILARQEARRAARAAEAAATPSAYGGTRKYKYKRTCTSKSRTSKSRTSKSRTSKSRTSKSRTSKSRKRRANK